MARASVPTLGSDRLATVRRVCAGFLSATRSGRVSITSPGEGPLADEPAGAVR